MLLEDLARTEGDNPTGGDADLLAGPWVSPFSGSFAPDHEVAEPGDLDRLSFLENRLDSTSKFRR